MRIFTGFFLPPSVAHSLGVFTRPLRKLRGVRWVKPESLHVTLQFLGQIDPQKLPAIQSALMESRGKTLRLACQGGGVFPPQGNAKIFWAGLTGDTEELIAMTKNFQSALAPLGFIPEDREFRPHITIGRAGAGPRPERSASEQFCTLFKSFKSPVFEVSEIQIIQSHLTGEGSRYEPIGSIPLAH